jgi:outer membrane protein
MSCRNSGRAVAALVLVLSSAAAWADGKIAVINSQVVQSWSQFKVYSDKLDAEFGKRKTDLAAQRKQIEDDEAKYKRDQSTMSPDQQAKAEKAFSEREIDFSAAARKLQEDYQNRAGDANRTLNETVRATIKQVALEKGYDVVLADPVYASSTVDISADVLKRLNALPPPAPAAAPGK